MNPTELPSAQSETDERVIQLVTELFFRFGVKSITMDDSHGLSYFSPFE